MELVACTGDAAQAHSLEAVMGLQMCKAHLNRFALVTRAVRALFQQYRSSSTDWRCLLQVRFPRFRTWQPVTP